MVSLRKLDKVLWCGPLVSFCVSFGWPCSFLICQFYSTSCQLLSCQRLLCLCLEVVHLLGGCNWLFKGRYLHRGRSTETPKFLVSRHRCRLLNLKLVLLFFELVVFMNYILTVTPEVVQLCRFLQHGSLMFTVGVTLRVEVKRDHRLAQAALMSYIRGCFLSSQDVFMSYFEDSLSTERLPVRVPATRLTLVLQWWVVARRIAN